MCKTGCQRPCTPGLEVEKDLLYPFVFFFTDPESCIYHLSDTSLLFFLLLSCHYSSLYNKRSMVDFYAQLRKPLYLVLSTFRFFQIQPIFLWQSAFLFYSYQICSFKNQYSIIVYNQKCIDIDCKNKYLYQTQFNNVY